MHTFISSDKSHDIFNGSKAKLPATKEDILELVAEDSDYYLSEIDESPKRLCSAVVKPDNLNQITSTAVKKGEHQQRKKLHDKTVQRTRGLVNPRKRTHTQHNSKPYSSSDFTSAKPHGFAIQATTTAQQRTFETRGTQTERTGICKCARAVQEKNRRRRLDHKKNKQLIAALAKHHSLNA